MKAIVIGHGPSLKNAGLGNKIDNFDGYVIRLTNRKWQTPEDYGTKIDYVCAAHEVKRLSICFTESIPNIETWIYAHKSKGLSDTKKLIKEHPERKFVICRKETTPWVQRSKDLLQEYREKTPVDERGRFIKHFSQGLGAIIIAIQRLNLIEILLPGCDNLLKGTTNGFFSYACLDISNKPRCILEHHYGNERIILDEALAKYKVKLVDF